MTIDSTNIYDYILNNDLIEEIFAIHDFGEMFDVLGTKGGDALHYRIRKIDGAIYQK